MLRKVKWSVTEGVGSLVQFYECVRTGDSASLKLVTYSAVGSIDVRIESYIE